MDKDRAIFYTSSTKYDPKQSKNISVVMNPIKVPCMITGLSNKRQLETFGNLTSADSVARLLNRNLTDVTHAEINSRKFKIAKISNYQNDTVIYLKEVSEW